MEPDGVDFDAATVRADIRENQVYLGTRVKLEARVFGAVIGLQVDVGYGDAVVPPPSMIDYPSLLEFAAPHVSAYSRYTVVAEKLQATVELGVTNSRLKDLFDLFTLASRFDFEGPQMVEAITATFGRRGSAIPVEPPAALSRRFAEAPNSLAQWKGFLKGTRVRIDVADAVARFTFERCALPEKETSSITIGAQVARGPSIPDVMRRVAAGHPCILSTYGGGTGRHELACQLRAALEAARRVYTPRGSRCLLRSRGWRVHQVRGACLCSLRHRRLRHGVHARRNVSGHRRTPVGEPVGAVRSLWKARRLVGNFDAAGRRVAEHARNPPDVPWVR